MSEEHGLALVEEQFDDKTQQHLAASLGMWIFLTTEVLFFGGLIAAYCVYRFLYLPAFEIGSRDLSVMWGAINTAVLICSSLFMAMAVRAAQMGKRKLIIIFLIPTLICGVIFLFIKLYEEWYRTEYLHGLMPGINFTYTGPHAHHVQLFMFFYFMLTGLHGFHMFVGICVIVALIVLAARGHFDHGRFNTVEIAGLYWHFVDIVWIFLFPLLYLIGGRYPR